MHWRRKWQPWIQCSCLENPRDGGAWWAAIYGVAQIRTRLKRLSSAHSPSSPQLRLPTRFLISEHSCPPTLHTHCQQSALLHPHSNFLGSLFCIPRTTSYSLRHSKGQLPTRCSDKPTLLLSRDPPGEGGDWSQEGLNLALPSLSCCPHSVLWASSLLWVPPGRAPTSATMKTLPSLTCLDITVENCDF